MDSVIQAQSTMLLKLFKDINIFYKDGKGVKWPCDKFDSLLWFKGYPHYKIAFLTLES